MSHLSPARAAELLERAAGVRVLVVGDLMLDRYVAGRVERISPEAPVPVVLVEKQWSALGGAGNVASNVTALGSSCIAVGCVGDDPEGEQLLAELDAMTVDATGVLRDAARPTTVKTRVHAGPQQLVRLDREVERSLDGPVVQELTETIRERVDTADVLVVQDYDKGVLTPAVIRTVMEGAAAVDRPVVVDPKRRAFFDYAGATVLKPNRREIEAGLGEPVRPDDPVWMERARQRLGCRHLLVTLGGGGMALETCEARLVRLPGAERAVYDVSGAGDTVSATVAVALAAGASVIEAAALANHAADIEVQRPGARTVTSDELLEHVRALAG